MKKNLGINPGAYLIQILESVDIDYAVLHGWESLPDNLQTDLDIVVTQKKILNLKKKLYNINIINILQHEKNCFYFAIRYSSSKELALLDVATDFRRNGFVWIDSKDLLNNKLKYKDFWKTNPIVEYKYILIKKILKAQFSEQSRVRLINLTDELGDKSKDILKKILGNYWANKLHNWLLSSNWVEVERHAKQIKRALYWNRFKQAPLNPILYWIDEIQRAFIRWTNPTGYLICVLGPDGSGKSTLIGRLQMDFLGAFRATENLHFMPCVLYKKRNHGPVTEPHAKPPRSTFTSILKLAYYWLNYTLGYWTKVRPSMVRSTLVLFDRYYHDLLADPRRYRYGAPLWAARLVGAYIPKPDLFIILDLPAEVAHARKPEVHPDDAKRLRQRYLDLASNLPNARVVDANRPLDVVVDEVEEILLEQMAKHTKTRLCKTVV